MLNARYTWRSRSSQGIHLTWQNIGGSRLYGFHDLGNDRAIVVQCRFEGAHDTFSEGMGGVQKNEKWGYVDAHDEVVITPRFDWCRYFSEGRAAVRIGTKYGFIDRQGELRTPLIYDDVGDYSEGLAAVRIDSKWGYVDLDGKEVIQPQFREANPFSEGLAAVTSTQRISEYYKNVGFIDREGTMVISPRFSAAGPFSEGLAPVRVGDRWDYDIVILGKSGYCDRKGEIVIEPEFFQTQPFLEGRAAAQKRTLEGGPGLWGYIDKSSKWVVAPVYELQPSGFSGGIARYFSGLRSRTYWMDRDGKIAKKPAFR